MTAWVSSGTSGSRMGIRYGEGIGEARTTEAVWWIGRRRSIGMAMRLVVESFGICCCWMGGSLFGSGLKIIYILVDVWTVGAFFFCPPLVRKGQIWGRKTKGKNSVLASAVRRDQS